MKLEEFENKLLILAKNSTEKITPSNVSYYLKTSVSESKKYLEELASNAILNMDFDNDGNVFFDFPNMTREDNKKELSTLLNKDLSLKLCPYCQEKININAKKCIHCKEIISKKKKKFYFHLVYFIALIAAAGADLDDGIFGSIMLAWAIHYVIYRYRKDK